MEEIITLSPSEFFMAVTCETMRQVTNRVKGVKHKYGCQLDKTWDMGIEGACAEAAFAKFRNIYWNGNIGDFRAADVGAYQVRSTTYSTGHLIVHPADKDDDIFILLVGKAPEFKIVGWTYGHEAKNNNFWSRKTGRPAFFVPQSELKPIDTLPEPNTPDLHDWDIPPRNRD